MSAREQAKIIDVYEGFRAFCLQNSRNGSRKSSSSYVTRLKKAFKIADPAIKTLVGTMPVDKFVSRLHPDSLNHFIVLVEAVVAEQYDSTSNRSYRDIISALRLFRKFATIKLTFGKKRCKENIEQLLKPFKYFTPYFMRKQFRSRINTWDRYSSSYCFPFRIWNSVFSSKNLSGDYAKLKDEIIDNFKFVIGKGRYARFKDVGYVRIKADKQAVVFYRGKEYPLYDDKTAASPFLVDEQAFEKCKGFGIFSIDHDEALDTVGKDLDRNSYPQIYKLGLHVLNYVMNVLNNPKLLSDKKRGEKIAAAYKKSYDSIVGFDAGVLYKDVEKLFRKTEYFIIDYRKNSSKGARVHP